MKQLISSIFIIVVLFAQKPTTAQYNAINEKELYRHLSFLASDEMKGRDTGSPELKIAARYLASQLESYGYQGLGENGSFFQPVPMYQTKFSNEDNYLEFNGKKIEYEIGKDLSIYSWGNGDLDIEAEMVSVALGLQTEADKSYKKTDVEGKIAIRFDLDSTFNEQAKSDQAYIHQNIRNKLFENKARVVINVIEDEKRAKNLITNYARYAVANRMSLKEVENPRAYILMAPQFYKRFLKTIGQKKLSKKTVKTLSGKLKLHVGASAKKILSQNVVAYLKGSDAKLRNEYVGYGAHYDHIGMNADGSINNGADDDGSGTVGVLGIAKAIALNPPKRSTFIIFHTAEEKGLFGSQFYSEHPLMDLKNMVAMINIDMIGSYYKLDTVDVVGADRISQELHDINETENKALDQLYLEYKYNAKDHPDRIYFRSDHYNYAKKGVPIIFYTNDNPKHYHKASDTVDTINFTKLKKIARLAFSTGFAVQNKAKRLKINDDFKLDSTH